MLLSILQRLGNFYLPNLANRGQWFRTLELETKTLRLLLTGLLLYNFTDVLGFCTAATDDLLRQRIGHPHDFSHRPPALAALLAAAEQQFWLLHNTGLPGHWGPSGWGLLLGAAAAALLLSFMALLSAHRPVEAIFSFLLLLLSMLLPLLSLEAEYVGAIHLMVYPGAILIFFSFATLTTDQLGHWDQPSLGGRANLTRVGMPAWLSSRLPALLVALPLLLLWWSTLQPRLGFSPLNRAGQPSAALLRGEEELLPEELLRSSDLVTLGLEIFQRRLLSLTLLGLLLLLAFLTALELLAPQRRRRSSSLFPRLGAGLAATLGLQPHPRPLPLRNPYSKGATAEQVEHSLAQWNYHSGDVWLLLLLPLLALGLGALATRRYAFLHSFLLLEALGLLLNLFFVVAGVAADDLGGSLLVLFTVAVAAAETAVGLALFLALSQGHGTSTTGTSAPDAAAARRRTRRWLPRKLLRSSAAVRGR